MILINGYTILHLFFIIFCIFSWKIRPMNLQQGRKIPLPNFGTNNCGKNVFLEVELNEKCSKGILICYQSNLAPDTHGFMHKPSRRFQIATKPSANSVEKFGPCKNDDIQRNGILLSVIMEVENGAKMVQMESSTGYYFSFITNGNWFTIQLKGATTLSSSLTGCQDLREFEELEQIGDLNHINAINGMGAYFDDHVGLWQLGLDMLSVEKSAEKVLFIHDKSCQDRPWKVNITDVYRTHTITTAPTHPSTKTTIINKSTTTKTRFFRPSLTPDTPEVAKRMWAHLDPSLDPCEDFHAFSCNGKKVQNEGDHPILSSDVWTLHEELLNFGEGNTRTDSKTEHMVKEFYNICIDELKANKGKFLNASVQINKLFMQRFGGVPAIVGPSWRSPFNRSTEFWKMIGQFKSQFGLFSFVGALSLLTHDPVPRNVFIVTQPIGLYPHRRIMVESGLSGMLREYRKEVNQLFFKFGRSFLHKDVNKTYAKQAVEDTMILAMKIALALVHEDIFFDIRHYVPYKFSDLSREYPYIDWEALFDGMGFLDRLKEAEKELNQSYSLYVAHPTYFAFLNTLFDDDQWHQNSAIFNFIAMQIMNTYRPYILRSKMSKNTPPVPQLSNGSILQCLNQMERLIPFGIGYIYTKLTTNRDAIVAEVNKEAVLIFEAFGKMLDSLEWLSAESNKKAHEKLANMSINIGWPMQLYGDFKNTTNLDNFHSAYEKVSIDRHKSNWFDMYLALQDALHRTGFPDEFQMSPFTDNAFNAITSNEMIIPLRFLTMPMFNIEFPHWYNFAAEGMVVGHELSHGFDSKGVLFGTKGELSECNWAKCGWLDANSSLGFNEMAQCVIQQYSTKCCPLKKGPIRCLNGELAQGENTADIAGAHAAYNAYQDVIGLDNKMVPELDQFTNNQLFWIAHAQIWCTPLSNKKALVLELLTDSHAPGKCRVNQVYQNIPDFGRDFNCKIGSQMYPKTEDRCKVWTGE